jgi:hypothetical protein
MKHRSAAFILGLVLFGLLAGSIAAQENIPTLVAGVDAAKYPGQDSVMVFDRTQVAVEDTGLSVMTMHQLIKVLTVEGAAREMTRVFEYDPKSSMVDVRRICLWRDGQAVEQDLAQGRDIPAPAFMIYWGNRAKVFQLPRLKVGDAIELEFVRKGFVLALLDQEADEERYIPPMRGQFFDIVPFYASYPVLEKTYTVRIHKSKPLQYKFFHSEVETETRMDGDFLVYRWTKRNMDPWKSEPNAVSPDDVAPKLIVTTTATWKDKSAWFYKVNEDYPSFQVTPEIKAKVDELLRGVTDEERKIEILTHWAADNIRYSGLSMGKGEGYTLHPGAMTFRDRCGVCKDKAGMLVTLLRAAGFESYPAMTMAGSRIEDIPADQFNHSVTIVKRSDGRYQLLDPTWVPGVRELWSSLEQEQQYLMGVPETAGLLTTPWSPPEKHYINVTSECSLDEQGDLSGRVRIDADGQGDAAIRRVMLRNPLPQIKPFLASLVTSWHPTAEVGAVQYLDPYDLSKPMSITLDFRCPGFARVADGAVFLASPVLSQYLSDGGTAPFLHFRTAAKERKYPLAGRCTGTYRWTETIRVPAGFVLKPVPEPIRLDGDAASYERTIGWQDGTIRVDATLVLKKRIFPVEMYANLKQVLDSLREERTRTLVLEKVEVQR